MLSVLSIVCVFAWPLDRQLQPQGRKHLTFPSLSLCFRSRMSFFGWQWWTTFLFLLFKILPSVFFHQSSCVCSISTQKPGVMLCSSAMTVTMANEEFIRPWEFWADLHFFLKWFIFLGQFAKSPLLWTLASDTRTPWLFHSGPLHHFCMGKEHFYKSASLRPVTFNHNFLPLFPFCILPKINPSMSQRIYTEWNSLLIMSLAVMYVTEEEIKIEKKQGRLQYSHCF